MEYNQNNNFYQNLFIPLEPKILNENNTNQSQKKQINNNNIFGLNFHQDEENDENNEIINSLHFSKYNIDNSNNYEQKIKNNKNIIESNINKNIQDSSSSFINNEEEPYQISVSKYAESYFDNRNIINNSKINNNFNENYNNNNAITIKKTKSFKNIPKNSEPFLNNQKNNMTKKIQSNLIKHNLILNNNYYINNNNSNMTNNNIPLIVHTKSFSSKRETHQKKILPKKNQEKEKDIQKLNYHSLHNYYKIPKQNKIINNNKKYNPNNYKTQINQYNKNIYYKNNKKNNNSNINNNNHHSVRTHSFNINQFISNNNSLNNNTIKEENFRKIYTKKQKAELDMVRGCFIYDKKYSNFDIKNGNNTINYIKFIKPSEPILQINYKNVDKFYPLIRKKFLNELNPINTIKQNNFSNNSNNDNINNELIIYNENQNIINNNNNRKILMEDTINTKNNNISKSSQKKNITSKKTNSKKNNLTYDFDNQNFNLNINQNISQNTNSNITYTTINTNNNKDNDGISFSLKKKIYDWLVDIDIIKDKIIKIESLPTLCINGVLLCDLINRCEGKNEILKGIIRRTNTRSQIQVNINKVLEYLRTLEKFPSRNLWNNIEISKGNNLIIWQLLEDIYNFYGNKITFNKKYKKGNKNKNNNNMNKTFDKDYDNININTTPKSNKMNTLNSSQNNNNRLKCLNKINNNDKHCYTPDYYNKIQKRKKNLNLNDNLIKNNINNDFSENYQNLIYDNSQKIFKKEINNNKINNPYPYKFTNESSNRNNLNHTNDNYYESKMFSMETSFDKSNKNNFNTKITSKNNKMFPKNLDISSISSDRFINVQKNNKSFSVNNGTYNNRLRKNKNIGNNQSFYSTNVEDNRKFKGGGFLLFEKSSINKLKEKLGNFNKYNINNDLDTLDIKNI